MGTESLSDGQEARKPGNKSAIPELKTV